MSGLIIIVRALLAIEISPGTPAGQGFGGQIGGLCRTGFTQGATTLASAYDCQNVSKTRTEVLSQEPVIHAKESR
ncbi:hypothetical protein I7860_21825 [Pseudomonas tolaasii]|nr:hypothetical protein [Pseudomonas tolaasii]